MVKFAAVLPGVVAALLNVSMAREGTEYLELDQTLDGLQTAPREPLFVHVPATAGGSEQVCSPPPLTALASHVPLPLLLSNPLPHLRPLLLLLKASVSAYSRPPLLCVLGCGMCARKGGTPNPCSPPLSAEVFAAARPHAAV